MQISLNELIKKYNIVIRGILHIGAHECEEINFYEQFISRDNILWIEAIPDKVNICKNRFLKINIENAVVSDKEEDIIFNISNNYQSSSIFDFGLHSFYHPEIYYIDKLHCRTKLLKNIIPKYNIDFNFLNLDIQGAELKALKGMDTYLLSFDCIYTEVSSENVYQGGALITELDEYLKQYNFIRVETFWTPYKWGEAFYVKKNYLINK